MIEARLAAGLPIGDAVALVAAHPDDETLGAGGRLAALRRLTLIHLTDGSPRDLRDAHRAGYADAPDYAAARRRELVRALDALAVRPLSQLEYPCSDQEAAAHLADMARWLERRLERCDAVVTHAYEHGHPDHDAAAFAVHAACALLRRRRGCAPAIVEFPSYHLRDGAAVFARFWPDPCRRECRAPLDDEQRSRKSVALACFATQQDVIASFPLDAESYRSAPAYDFTRPAPPREAFYDRLGWTMTSARWRALAAAALRELGFGGAL